MGLQLSALRRDWEKGISYSHIISGALILPFSRIKTQKAYAEFLTYSLNKLTSYRRLVRPETGAVLWMSVGVF